MEPWFSHRILYRILNLKIKYIIKSPLRIGSGRGFKLSSPIDLPVIRIKMGEYETPYIPGSSIKGVFRATSEYVVRSSGLYACNRGDECKNKYDKSLQSYLRELYKQFSLNDVYNILNKYCIVCKIFGSGSYKSHIDFIDAYPTNGVSTGVKVGIAIDRRSGATKRGVLYTIEYINPGAEFEGIISMSNLPNYGVGLIANVIDLINLGIIKMGGMKSRGFGKVSIKLLEANLVVSNNGTLNEVKDKTVIKALDEFDEDLEYIPREPEKYLETSKEVWKRYVEKIKSKGS